MFKSYSQNRVKNLNRDVVRYLFFYFFRIFFFILSHSCFDTLVELFVDIGLSAVRTDKVDK